MNKLFISTLKAIILVFTLFLLSSNTIGQISISPNGTFGVCPGSQSNGAGFIYTADLIDNYYYDWTVTNGVILNGTIQQDGTSTFSGGNIINVTWNNTTQDGSIKVRATSYSDNKQYLEKKVFYHILSINGVTPGEITGPPAVPFNAGSLTYSCPKLVYPNLGSGDATTLSVDTYKWLIPQGWTLNGQVSDGTTPFTGLTNAISVVPNPTGSGAIKVWGHSNCGGGYDSNPRSLTITRVFPSNLAIAASTSNSSVQGDKRPITVSVPNWSYAQYSWTKPATWQWQGGNTSATAAVIPDGCTGGNVSCQITIPATNQSTTNTRNYANPVTYPASAIPYISGSSLICSSSTPFTTINLPAFASSVTWNQSGNLISTSGQSTNSYYLRSNGSGNGWVSASFNSGCGDVPVPTAYYVTVGSPVPGAIAIEFDAPPRRFTATIDGVATANTYKWYLDGVLKYTTPSTSVIFQRQLNNCGHVYYVDVVEENACGVSSISHTETVEDPCYYGFTISPNPASDNITLTIGSADNASSMISSPTGTKTLTSKYISTKAYTIRVLDSFGALKVTLNRSGETVTLPVENLDNGIYVVEITDGKNVYRQQLVIKH
ncbi:MAG: T9SS type A sorting domain-containing protein [Bacteroidales bacterium]|nr:T9SS type A sorting domain-containing protein [Bacteroidales bacterium]